LRALGVALLLWPLPLQVAPPPPPPPTPAPVDAQAAAVKGADLPLLEEVRRIAGNVELLRGEEFLRPPLAVRVPDDMRRVAAEIRASNVLRRDRLSARGRAWADVGLGGPEAPWDLLLALAADLADVGFDPAGHRLLVSPVRLTASDFVPERASESEPSTVLMMTGVRRDEPLVAHLLTHVRQHERAGRDRLEPTTDRLLATMAWAEGEANLVAMRYLFRAMDLADEVLEHGLDPGEVLDGGLLPAGLDDADGVVGRLLRFVYREGFDRAARAYRAGGFAELERASQARRTTRDLLHPERGDAPAELLDPPQTPAVGAWVRADEDVLGEQAIIELVSVSTGKDNLGLLAGDGWAGDRLLRWETAAGPGGPGITEWITRWTTADEAADFAYAWGRTIEARFPGRALAPAEGERRMLAIGDLVYRLELRADTVRVRVAPAEWDARLENAAAGS
jgi:hypothetical protein